MRLQHHVRRIYLQMKSVMILAYALPASRVPEVGMHSAGPRSLGAEQEFGLAS